MKRIGRLFLKIIASALTLTLFVVLLPYFSKLANQLLPSVTDYAISSTMLLSQHLETTGRLETITVDEENILDNKLDVPILGTVQHVTIHYRYEASIGVDLREATLHIRDNQLTLVLPELEVLNDSLTLLTIDKQDFLQPLSEKDRLRMLEDERLERRAHYLENYIASEEGWQRTCNAVQGIIQQCLGDTADRLTVSIEKAENAQTN